MRCSISDQALMHGIKLAENAITTFQLQKSQQQTSDQSSRVKFMLSKPQYCYIVCVYLCAKMHDLTYPYIDIYLSQSQKCSNLLKNDENETSFFQSVLLQFADFEVEILRATNLNLSFVPEPNGDQAANPFALYDRFACAHGLERNSQEFHLGLYLLYIGLFEVHLVTRYTYTQLACASLHLSVRMVQRRLDWPEYLQQVTHLEIEAFRETCQRLATVYVQLVNREERFTAGYDALLKKFSNAVVHKAVANFVPERSQK